jgi:hypothetical protein
MINTTPIELARQRIVAFGRVVPVSEPYRWTRVVDCVQIVGYIPLSRSFGVGMLGSRIFGLGSNAWLQSEDLKI